MLLHVSQLLIMAIMPSNLVSTVWFAHIFIILHFLSPTATADGVNSAEYDGEEGRGCATAFLLDVGQSLIIIYQHDGYWTETTILV